MEDEFLVEQLIRSTPTISVCRSSHILLSPPPHPPHCLLALHPEIFEALRIFTSGIISFLKYAVASLAVVTSFTCSMGGEDLSIYNKGSCSHENFPIPRYFIKM